VTGKESHIRIIECDGAGPGRRLAAVMAALVLAGCAMGGPPLDIDLARTGETVVRLRASQGFDELAAAVYGDSTLGPALAELAHLPYDEPLGRGEILILPAREDMEVRLQMARTADIRFADGLAAADKGAYRQAADLFREALAAAPHRLDVRYNLGLALLKAGEAAEATPILEEVARLRPDHADSRYAFGSALRQRRAWDRALAEFEAARRADPHHAPTAYAIARTLEDRGDRDEAEKAYRSFLRRFPDDPLTATAAARLKALEETPEPKPLPPSDLIAP